MNFYKILTLLLVYQSAHAIEENETTLVLVQVMFRHGIRTVLLNYPNDTNQAYWEKYGLGQLAPAGMKQLQEYGSFIMNKYSSFLNPTYNRNRVYARSTDYDRTLQSTAAFLSGMYQPNSDQVWTDFLGQSSWLPIPVHTTNLSTDNILHANAHCPRYEQLKTQMRSTPDYLQLQNTNQPFINNLTQYSGLKNLDQYMIWQIADKYMVQEALGLPSEQYILDNLEQLMKMNDYTFYIDFVTTEMGKLISGGLLNTIVSNMRNKINGSGNEIFIFGLHDNYVAGIQKLLNTSTDFVQPDFASGFVFELRQDSSNNYFVKVLFKNNKATDPISLVPVTIYGCDDLCPFDKFLGLVKDNLVTDFTLICMAHPTNFYETIVYYFNLVLNWF